ncbi:MAG: Rrf2 family transcriptional regulator [Rhodothalassiaceae bacterium]
MFRFSRKMIYAVEAVLYVALNGRESPVQSRAITRRQEIPERYLEQALQRLVRVGILKGVRGPRGGYQLARPADRITLGEVVGVIRAMDNGEEESADGSDLGRDLVMPIFESLDAEVMERLDRITIGELVARAEGRSESVARILERA